MHTRANRSLCFIDTTFCLLSSDMKMGEEALTSSRSHVTLLKTSTIGGLLKTLAGRLIVCTGSDGMGSPGLMCLC